VFFCVLYKKRGYYPDQGVKRIVPKLIQKGIVDVIFNIFYKKRGYYPPRSGLIIEHTNMNNAVI